MDLDPFVPVGIEASTMRMLDVFLLHCLLADSPPDTPDEIAALGRNQHRSAAFGREPGLKLERDGREVPLIEWGAEILEACSPIAQRLDAVHGGAGYREALAAARLALQHPDLLPSARVLDDMRNVHDGSYTRFVRVRSEAARDHLLALPFPADLRERFVTEAQASLAEQRRIEKLEQPPFEVFRQQYLAPETLVV